MALSATDLVGLGVSSLLAKYLADNAGQPPGGITGSIQFNNNDVFDGSDFLTWDDVNHFLYVYRTFTDENNYERLALKSGSGFVQLAAETAGSGTDNIGIRLTPAGTGAVSVRGVNGNPGTSFVIGTDGHAGNLLFEYTGSSFRHTIETDNGNTKIMFNTSGGFPIASAVGWGVSVNDTTDPDVITVRDAAGVLAQRNGTNAQTFRWYRTFTDASNYERGALNNPSSGIVELAAETAGTGNDNIDVQITPAGTGKFRYGVLVAGTGTVDGYIEIKDSGGTLRKLAVLTTA